MGQLHVNVGARGSFGHAVCATHLSLFAWVLTPDTDVTQRAGLYLARPAVSQRPCDVEMDSPSHVIKLC